MLRHFLKNAETYAVPYSFHISGLQPEPPSLPAGRRRKLVLETGQLGNGRNTVSRVLFRRENSLSSTANSVSSARNSVSSRLHTNNRLKGTHWARSPELSEPRKTHWVRCLKPYFPKPYSARSRPVAMRAGKNALLCQSFYHSQQEIPRTPGWETHVCPTGHPKETYSVPQLSQRAPNPQPNLHSPVWVGSSGGRPQP